MKISTCGEFYENFQRKRVFVSFNSDRVTIKSFCTRKGRIDRISRWICLSVKSGKPIIYRFASGIGIRNITYFDLEEELRYLFALTISGETDRQKCKRLTDKFIELSSKLVSKCKSLKSLNATVIRSWLPALKDFNINNVINVIPALSQPIVRNGLKKESLEKAAKFWFGRLGSDEELISKLGKAIEADFSTLMLAIACKDWDKKHLYKLLESKFSWGCELEIARASQLFNNYYNEEVWLRLFNEFTDLSYTGKMYDLCEVIDLCEAIDSCVMEYELLPADPRSIEEILDLSSQRFTSDSPIGAKASIDNFWNSNLDFYYKEEEGCFKSSLAELIKIVPKETYAVIYEGHIIECFLCLWGWSTQVHCHNGEIVTLSLDVATEALAVSTAKQWIDNRYKLVPKELLIFPSDRVYRSRLKSLDCFLKNQTTITNSKLKDSYFDLAYLIYCYKSNSALDLHIPLLINIFGIEQSQITKILNTFKRMGLIEYKKMGKAQASRYSIIEINNFLEE